ncbi:MAG: alpha/beta hydrolase [Mesorhizobium sp.]|nr:alpha/beta hydrolase [Mesorhizobium sp.]
MKAKEVDIIIVPGYGDSGDAHWQTRWTSKLSTARRVLQNDWMAPDPAGWAIAVANAVNSSERPAVLVAHSLGIASTISAISAFRRPVAGAFLVAPPDLDDPNLEPRDLARFGPYPRDPLPFPSVTVGSQTDPYCALAVAEDLAAAWGSLFINAGDAGHINSDAGYGPWPEGSMAFGAFLGRLRPDGY